MRSYRQYCPVAKALDVVGDRWSLLIVRELLIRGPCRYTDVRKGVPGIATNLLAERLRELEQAGVIRREAAPPPIATTLFHLTPRGEDLRPAMLALGRWGAPLMEEAPDDDVFQTHWRWPMPAEAGSGTQGTRRRCAGCSPGPWSASDRPAEGVLRRKPEPSGQSLGQLTQAVIFPNVLQMQGRGGGEVHGHGRAGKVARP